MIVDDEYLIRELIKKSFDWDLNGFEIIAEAGDGEAALEKALKMKPDIILLDINIPYMNGIEFGGIIAEKMPQVQIIIISGYNSFEYARECITIKVFDYLLKPINEDILKNVLLKAKEKIEKERSKLLEFENMKKELYRNMPVLKENFLCGIVLGEFTRSDIEDNLTLYGLKYTDCQIAIIELDYFNYLSFNESEEVASSEMDKLVYKMAVYNITQETMAHCKIENVIFNDKLNKIIILFYKIENELDKEVEDLLNLIIKHTNEYLKITVTIGVGRCCDSIYRAQYSYKEAFEAVRFKTVLGNNKVILYDEIKSSSLVDFKMPKMDVDNLISQIKLCDEASVREIIDEYFTVLVDKKINNIDYLCTHLIKIASNIQIIKYEMGTGEIPKNNKSANIYHHILKCETVKDMKNALMTYCLEIIGGLSKFKRVKYSKVVENAINYIHEHYSNCELNLNDVATHIYINPSYLSFVFKQQTNATFTEYLNNYRIEKAKEYIRSNSSYMAYEIAEKVGYNNPNYFSSCFKKITGMSINEYKKL